jgi:adenine-specific DNA-methyltransferase
MSKLGNVRKMLGKPAYEAPGVLIYQGDCLEAMKRIPDGLVELTVTSPPYNIGKEYESNLPLNEYLEWCRLWLEEIARISAAKAAFWLNLGYVEFPERAKAVPLPYLLWDKVPMFLLQEVVWHYGAGVAARHSFSPRNEKFLWYVKSRDEYTFNLDDVRDPNVKYPNQKKNGKLKCNPLGKNPTDVWDFPKVTSGTDRSSSERTSHPAQFPLAVIDRIVRACSDAGDLVLDPFMGSGTSAEAALRAGRDVVGFELEPNYIDIIAGRLERARVDMLVPKVQSPLFADVTQQFPAQREASTES